MNPLISTQIAFAMAAIVVFIMQAFLILLDKSKLNRIELRFYDWITWFTFLIFIISTGIVIAIAVARTALHV